MADETLTLADVVAVHPWLRFRRRFVGLLDASIEQVRAEGLLEGLHLSPRTWQDAHQRMGYLAPVERGHPGAFGFLGLYVGPESVFEGVPDLYFFMEVPRGTGPQREVDARAVEITDLLTPLNRQGRNIYWGYKPGGWEGLWAVKSLLDVVRSGEPGASMTAFYQHTLYEARHTGLMDIFLAPAALLPPGAAPQG